MKNAYHILAICIVVSLGCRSGHRSDDVSPQEPGGQVRRSSETRGRNQRHSAEALYGAVLLNDLDAVKQLVAEGADVNQDVGDGVTPLHAAASSESEQTLEIMKVLLAHGADVNAKVRDDNPADMWAVMGEGWTPLHHAVSVTPWGEALELRSNKAVVELLLTHGASVNERDADGYTALFDATSLDVMELLIERGANVNVKNSRDGGTVLHDAASNGHLDVVELLIAHGANLRARDFDGETPLHRAALGRCPDIVDFLVEHGADLHARSNRDETPQDFLDEPNTPEPIVLPDSSEPVFSLIITDGLAIRQMLKSKSIDYDSLWLPTSSEIGGLRPSLRGWLEKKASQAKNTYVDHDRILKHFDQYDREYAGFTKNGRKYILCNMVQFPTDPALRSPRNRFSGMFDGGCSWVIVIFEDQTKQIVRVQCNNM